MKGSQRLALAVVMAVCFSPGSARSQTRIATCRDAEDPGCEAACDAGKSQACVVLGAAVEQRDPSPISDARALTLYARGCTLGQREHESQGCQARDVLAAILSTNVSSGTPSFGYHDGEAKLAQGCADGSIKACGILGVILEERTEIEGDTRWFKGNRLLAPRLLLKACANGGAEGCDGLRSAIAKNVLPTPFREKARALVAEPCVTGTTPADCASEWEKTAERLSAKEHPRADLLRRLACEGGSAVSCRKLADILAALPEKRDVLVRSCDLGDLAGCDGAGAVLRQQGHSDEALVHFMKACDGAPPMGCRAAGGLWLDPFNHSRDSARGVALYTRACDGGDLDACRLLSDVYEKGEIVVRDSKRARELHDKACAEKRCESPPAPTVSVIAVGGLVEVPFSLAKGRTPPIGTEISFTHYPAWSPRHGGNGLPLGVGGFLHALVVGGDHAAIAVGPQVNITLVGVELGYSYEHGDATHVSTHGLHLAPFLSFGAFSAALRVRLPLSSSEAPALPSYPTDVAVAFTLKLPLLLDRDVSWSDFLPIVAQR